MDTQGWSVAEKDAEQLFNFLISSVLLLDSALIIQYLNPSAERFLGVSLQGAKGKKLQDFLKEKEGLLPPLEEVVQSGRPTKIHEMKLSPPQGPWELQVEIAPLGVPEKPAGVLVFLEELSRAHGFQEENRVLDRLSMMGTLASGLAHEIRNPLGGIRAAAEMLLREQKNDEHQEYLQMILLEVDRLNNLITQLLDFSKPRKIQKYPLNINQLLSELTFLQKETLHGQGIQLKQAFDPSLPPVLGHSDSLKQAFLNLLKNSLEAMPHGGELKLNTTFITDYRIKGGDGQPQPMIQVSISDTGRGITQEEMENLFTPFFTTKPHGTGLGLMMTQRILKEHEGLLRVSSKPEQGTTFRVFLKVAKGKIKE